MRWLRVTFAVLAAVWIVPGAHVTNYWSAFAGAAAIALLNAVLRPVVGVAVVASAVGIVLDVVFGTNDDDTYALRVIQRIARRYGARERTDASRG